MNPENEEGSSYRRLMEDLPENDEERGAHPLSILLGVLCCPLTVLFSCFTLNPQEEMVMLYWGRYSGTVRGSGLHFANCWGRESTRISTKKICQQLPKTTVVDKNGNPLIVSAVIVYNIVNSKRATLDIQNHVSFVQTQAETTLKQIISRFPYETMDDSPCLKTEADHIGQELCGLLQQKVEVAGARVYSFQLKEISYAPEIAAGMLKRQQAVAMLQARQTIVQGAVEIACHAVEDVRKRGIHLEPSEQSRLVTNILTVICSDRDVQPTLPLSI